MADMGLKATCTRLILLSHAVMPCHNAVDQKTDTGPPPSGAGRDRDCGRQVKPQTKPNLSSY